MAVTTSITIKGLKEAKADLERLNKEFEKVKDDPINSKKIAKEFNDLSKEIDKTTEELLEMKKAGKLVNETFDDINEVLLGVAEGAVLPLSTQIGEMEDRMYQLAAAGETNSDEFKNLQKEAARLRGVIIETDRSVDLLAENGGLQVFATGWSQVGERLISLDFEGASRDAQQLSASVGNLGKIGANAMKGLAQTVTTLAKTFVQFGVALLVNPIFLIVAVIAGVVAAVVLLKDKVKILGDAFNFFADIIGDSVQMLKDLTDWLGLTSFASDELAQAQIDSSKAVQDSLQEQLETQTQTIDREIKLKQAAGKSTVELEKEKQEAVKQTALDTLNALNQEIKARVALGNVTKEEVEELKKKVAEQKKIVKDSTTEIKAIEIKNQADIETKEKESYERRKAELEAFNKARLDASRLIQDLELSLLRDGLPKELQLNKVRFERLREDTLANTQLTLEEKNKLTELYTLQELQAERELRSKAFEDIKLDVEKLEIADVEEREKKLKAEIEQQEKIKAIREEYLAEQKAKRLQIEEDIVGSVNALMEGSFALSERFGKQDEASKEKRAKRQFQINKAMLLSTAIMDGYKAVTASLSQAPVAIGVLPNPVGIASLTFAVTTSLANIAKIAASQYTGSGSSGGGGGSASLGSSGGVSSSVSSSAPSFDLFGNSRDFNNVQDEGSAESGGNSITVNAVVSETEITTTQQRVSNLRSNAEL